MVTFSDVVKKFGKKTAVNHLSFELNRGEVLALLGPNGAGKSTTMKMLMGFLPVTKGSISVCGYCLSNNRHAAQDRMGYLPEDTPLYTDATVSEFLRFCASARKINAKKQKSALQRVLSLCGLETVKNQLIDTLSKGYKQRTCFAQSIIHDPDVLVMDEPTDGLDPNQQREIQNVIRELANDKAILLSSHHMDEAEFMADRILLLRDGRPCANGTVQELRKKLGVQSQLRITIDGIDNATQSQKIVSTLQQLPSTLDAYIDEAIGASENRSYTYFLVHKPNNNANVFHEVLKASQTYAWNIQSMEVIESGLKDIFHATTAEGMRTR